MIKRYLAKRDNPLELLLFAFCLLVPGIALLVTHKPVVLLSASRGIRSYFTVFPPPAAHLLGAILTVFGVVAVWLYFYARGYTGEIHETSEHHGVEPP